MKEQSIHEFTRFSTLKDAFKSMLKEAANIIEFNNSDLETWSEVQWIEYGDDIVEYLHGNLGEDYEDCEEDDLIDYCSMYDLTDAIKANSESFFGYDISEYLEN